MVLQALDPVHLFVKSIWGVAARKRNHATILLFKPNAKGEHCRGEDQETWFGGKNDHKITIGKMQCRDFKPWPIANMSMNYKTPDNKVDNHCQLTFFDGKQCTGETVYQINGALELDMINAQSYCHRMDFAKSVQMGPCT
ncbi:hypothetical protein Slin14017_G024800 [Septoria linicola]|nr:hypothetical protein Slin14017_G024800 [Septoria linicola]